jgi:hypothetical protein
MRVSPCGFYAKTLQEALDLAEQSAVVTHNHPEGVKGAQAIASAIFLAREGKNKEQNHNDNNFNKTNPTMIKYNSFFLLTDETPIDETRVNDNMNIENLLNNVKVSFDLESLNNNFSLNQKLLKEINSEKEEISQNIKELTELSEKMVLIENDLIKEKITNCLNKYDQYNNLTKEKLNQEDTNFINVINSLEIEPQQKNLIIENKDNQNKVLQSILKNKDEFINHIVNSPVTSSSKY